MYDSIRWAAACLGITIKVTPTDAYRVDKQF